MGTRTPSTASSVPSTRSPDGKQLFLVVAFEVAVGDGHTSVAAEGPSCDLYARRTLAAFVLGPVHELHDAAHIILVEARGHDLCHTPVFLDVGFEDGIQDLVGRQGVRV